MPPVGRQAVRETLNVVFADPLSSFFAFGDLAIVVTYSLVDLGVSSKDQRTLCPEVAFVFSRCLEDVEAGPCAVVCLGEAFALLRDLGLFVE